MANYKVTYSSKNPDPDSRDKGRHVKEIEADKFQCIGTFMVFIRNEKPILLLPISSIDMIERVGE